jgi:hypothetical protein
VWISYFRDSSVTTPLLDTHPMAIRSSLRWRITDIKLRFRRLCRLNGSVTLYPWDIQDHTKSILMAGSITFAQDACAVHFSVVTIAQLGLILIIVGNGWKIAFWHCRNCSQ